MFTGLVKTDVCLSIYACTVNVFVQMSFGRKTWTMSSIHIRIKSHWHSRYLRTPFWKYVQQTQRISLNSDFYVVCSLTRSKISPWISFIQKELFKLHEHFQSEWVFSFLSSNETNPFIKFQLYFQRISGFEWIQNEMCQFINVFVPNLNFMNVFFWFNLKCSLQMHF